MWIHNIVESVVPGSDYTRNITWTHWLNNIMYLSSPKIWHYLNQWYAIISFYVKQPPMITCILTCKMGVFQHWIFGEEIVLNSWSSLNWQLDVNFWTRLSKGEFYHMELQKFLEKVPVVKLSFVCSYVWMSNYHWVMEG